MSRWSSDEGTALIWFIALTVLTAMLALTLVSSIDQFLFAKVLKDFTEQFAIACKTLLLVQPNQSLQTASLSLWSQLDTPGFWIESISVEQGATVRVVICGNWSSPVDLVSATREICEVALAR
ncbi:MAG: hypothetical protein F2662_00125 [Actinobacteria bacterium]|uniref:Unannotated protein n=1 Tax=freshwater metagenome TaxID=449393 RepID=A0A6J6MV63_9ZZZZ|nr:hypothetical protein [Actinomycetota bacterium]